MLCDMFFFSESYFFNYVDLHKFYISLHWFIKKILLKLYKKTINQKKLSL